MRKSQLRGLAASTLFLASVIGIPLATAGPAAAAGGSIPAVSPTCSAGQPKLDYEWYERVNGGGVSDKVWSNVCGTGTWTWLKAVAGGGNYLAEIRMPTTPYHRVWLHLSGHTPLCLYSRNTDISVPATYDSPDDVQVAANTSPC